MNDGSVLGLLVGGDFAKRITVSRPIAPFRSLVNFSQQILRSFQDAA
jgi:hypothetical protein